MDTPSVSVKDLEDDHTSIERALDVLRREIEKEKTTKAVSVDLVREICAFSQSFVDRCHHGKEEGCFFPCLVRKGMPGDAGPIGVMLEEHERGRKLVARISESLERYERDGLDAGAVTALCIEYVELLTQHILKENSVLFPAGARMMEAEDDSDTLACFESKKESVGLEELEALKSRIENLAREGPA